MSEQSNPTGDETNSISKVEERFNSKLDQIDGRYNSRFDKMEARISRWLRMPNFTLACITILILAVALINFGQMQDSRQRLDSFLKEFPDKFDQYKKELRDEVLGQPNKSAIKFFKGIDEPLTNKTIKAIFYNDKGKNKLFFVFTIRNDSNYMTDSIYTKIYFASNSMLKSTSTDEPHYAKELFFDPEQMPSEKLPGNASVAMSVRSGNPTFRVLFEKGIREIPIMVKVYHGPAQPAKTEFFIEIVGDLPDTSEDQPDDTGFITGD